MQQLNVLPINVSQNVDVKDDTSVSESSSSKDDFSQHIDLHLAKNKGVSDSKNNGSAENVDTNKDQTSTEKKPLEANEKIQNSSGTSQAITDEAESAITKQEVAASGKTDEKVSSEEKPSEAHQAIDESELLMSFLTKVDKTLVEDNLTEEKNIGEMSAVQKAKHEAQLLLKASDLVGDLSGVAKAITSSSDAVSNDLIAQEKAVESLLASSKKTNIDTEINQLNAKTLIDGNTLKENNLASRNNDKSNEKDDVASLIKNIKATELTQSTSTQQSDEKDIDTGIEAKSSSQIGADSEKAVNQPSQKELDKQSFTSASKILGSSNEKVSPESSASVQKITNNQNPLEVEPKINEQIAALEQNEKELIKPEANLTSVTTVAQNTNTNTNTNTNNNNKDSSTAKLAKTVTESAVKQSNSVEPDVELTAKSVEHDIEQGKELGASENKDAGGKVVAKANTDFAINGSFTDSTSRTSQAVYDRVDQQVADIFNSTGSSEVSQSQKTNTQLHQETISIFRKDFSDAVKDKVMLMISQKLQQFDITLDPPELGNMQVRVNLQGEQATVNFVVQNQQAKDALEQNMHKLRDSLAEQGVDVGDANVEQQSQQSDKDESSGDNQNNLMTNTEDANDVIEHSLSARMFDSSATVVDYYA